MGFGIPGIKPFGFGNIFRASSNDGQVQKSRGSRRVPSDDDDTSTPLKKSDEIVVDAAGDGDFTTIQAALTELGASSGTIRVLAGVYTITSTLTIGANQTIFGSGYGTNITTTSNINLVDLSGNRSSIFMCRIDGNRGSSSQVGIKVNGDECIIRNCWITQMGDEGVQIIGDRCVMEGSRVEDCDDNCVAITGEYVMISDCVIENSINDGISMTSANFGSIVGNKILSHGEHGVDMTSCTQTTIVGNYIFSNGDNNNDGDGIDLNGNDNCITGNIIHSNDGWGITVSAGSTKNIIVGNTILNNEDGAVSDAGTSTHPNGASGTNNLELDDLNVIA